MQRITITLTQYPHKILIDAEAEDGGFIRTIETSDDLHIREICINILDTFESAFLDAQNNSS